MNYKFDRQNVLVSVIGALLFAGALIGWGVQATEANRKSGHEERMEELRVCNTIEDESTRTLCVIGGDE